MAESLKPVARGYQAVNNWLEGVALAREMGEVDLALTLSRAGIGQADRLRSEDADPDDPNVAIKGLWPSLCAYWRLIVAASQLSPQTALEQIREIKDPEISLLLEVKLASKKLGAPNFQSSVMVRKKSFSLIGGCAD